MRSLSLALVHHPVLDREGGEVTTAITNLDLHDIARSAKTFGVEAVYVVHPVEAQRALAERIRAHWVEGSGRRRIPDRGLALELLRVVPSLDEVYRDVAAGAGRAGLRVWTTAAAARDGETTSFGDAARQLADPGPPVVLLFGTGWGLAHPIVRHADVRLEPIVGRGPYNHLSVRAACAIALDRLLSGRGAAPSVKGPGTAGAPGTSPT